ncbi:MAG TPA: RNA polymerase sigma-70 factor [Gemmatimonadaceae bacterium]|nr:RNA polymerase sigma-70 factor [Gemmatimonadaceae bacterium]
MDTGLLTPHTVAAVRGGDRGAFERLFRATYADLADYAARIVASRDAAEDVVQDVFIAVWNRRDALPDADKLASYLYRAVRNRALNYLRAQRGTESLIDSDGGPAIAPEADDALAADEVQTALTSALGALSPRAREVFLLSREQHLTYNEIAVTLEISVKTVETLMGRALRMLREALADRLRG